MSWKNRNTCWSSLLSLNKLEIFIFYSYFLYLSSQFSLTFFSYFFYLLLSNPQFYYINDSNSLLFSIWNRPMKKRHHRLSLQATQTQKKVPMHPQKIQIMLPPPKQNRPSCSEMYVPQTLPKLRHWKRHPSQQMKQVAEHKFNIDSITLRHFSDVPYWSMKYHPSTLPTLQMKKIPTMPPLVL